MNKVHMPESDHSPQPRAAGHFRPCNARLPDSEYPNLQTDGHEFLCPDCGGYGWAEGQHCNRCYGDGTLPMDYPGIVLVVNRDD